MNSEINVLPKFEEAFYNEDPYLIIFGGSGSGKSFFAATKILIRTLNENNNRTLVIMKVGRKLRQYAYQTFIDVINYFQLNDLFHLAIDPLEITCIDNGNKILFSGLDSPEGIKSIPGIKNIWIEEATALNAQDFQQLNIRIRGETDTYKQIILTFNPTSVTHWIYKDFFKLRKYKPVYINKSTYRDNPFVGSDYEDRIKQSYENSSNLKVYLEGEWGEENSKLIYTNWKVDETISTKFEDYKNKFCGIDFGWNDPNVMLGIAFKENKVFIFKELYNRYQHLTDFIKQIKENVPRNILLIADFHEPGNIDIMRTSNLYVKPSDKTPNSINSGISFLKDKEILIHPSCINTIEEIQSYSYMYQPQLDIHIDKPTEGNDHCMDSLRYGSDIMRKRKYITVSNISLY